VGCLGPVDITAVADVDDSDDTSLVVVLRHHRERAKGIEPS
jgi:hypothetical protein